MRIKKFPQFKKFSICAFLFIFIIHSLQSQGLNLIKANRIYTANDAQPWVEAMVYENDKILFLGTYDSAIKSFPKLKYITITSNYVYPGFIDAHCHFYGYSKMRLEANLVGAKSKKKVIKTLKKFYKNTNAEWVLGRGWDQNLWGVEPDLETLDKAFPDRPVFLKRIDGHAAWLNTKALNMLKVDINKPISGGSYIMSNGKFTGVLLDNAVEAAEKGLPKINKSLLEASIISTRDECLKFGLTGLTEAGLEVEEAQHVAKIMREGNLPLRMNVMLSSSDNTMGFIGQNGWISAPRLRVNSVKYYIDGALGSRGALLKKPYCDRPTHGLQLMTEYDFYGRAYAANMTNKQVCAHAIGDSAAAVFMKVAKKLLLPGNDARWRMEHSQIVAPAEMSAMKKYNIIPSVQPTHATSDALWAPSRLCDQRQKYAYAYKSLLDSCGIIALGTDFPVEGINPLATFHSAVFRMDIDCKLKTPFMPEQALTRAQALNGMTIWAAYAAGMEKETGSLEIGKQADFVVLTKDIMTIPAKEMHKVKTTSTVIAGKTEYTK
jgi:hypothetical protein